MGIATILALVDGSVDAANGTVKARLAQDEGDDAVLHGHDGAQDPPVGGHDDARTELWWCGVGGVKVEDGRMGIVEVGGGLSES